MTYHRRYTWSHPLGDDAIAHTDGGVSVMIAWDGIDTELATAPEKGAAYAPMYQALKHIPVGVVSEWHLWREYDDQLARAYVAKTHNITRGGELIAELRRDQAAHLAQYAMANSVALVLTRRPRLGLAIGAKSSLRAQAKAAEALRADARRLTRFLPGARIATVSEFAARVQQSSYRAGHDRGRPAVVDPRFLLREQWVRERPVLDQSGEFVTVGGVATRVLFVYLYPDAVPGWIAGLAALPCPFHVCHIVEPTDTKAAMRSAERESDKIEALSGRRGRDYSAKGKHDTDAWRSFIAEHNLDIYRNAFIVHLHGSPDTVKQWGDVVTDWIDRSGGQVRSAPYVQLPYWRAAQPGQGHRAPMYRPDDTWQVGDMLPVQVYRSGSPDPESLRLGDRGQLIGFNYSSLSLRHSFSVAKTRGGKGVEKVATILETYPFNTDWYIAEIGQSYRWTVEALGGTYSVIDPDSTVINPLPPFKLADYHDGVLPLNAKVAGGTVRSLAFLLTDGSTRMTAHQEAAADLALQFLYAAKSGDPDRAPTLPDYLAELRVAENFETDEQRAAARQMADNLESFLSTTHGRRFAGQDNLQLSEGITGVDLKEVDRASEKLLQFYLVFLGLRFSHLAFAKRSPAGILLDEMHKFVAIAPDVMGRLIDEIARMGGKEAAFIDLVTQGTAEIDAIGAEVMNSMAVRTLLYRVDEHAPIAERINLPIGVLGLWQAFPEPFQLPYRPAVRGVAEDWYNLHLTFPDSIMALADTRPDVLDLKASIGQLVSDPRERIARLRAELAKKEKHHA